MDQSLYKTGTLKSAGSAAASVLSTVSVATLAEREEQHKWLAAVEHEGRVEPRRLRRSAGGRCHRPSPSQQPRPSKQTCAAPSSEIKAPVRRGPWVLRAFHGHGCPLPLLSDPGLDSSSCLLLGAPSDLVIVYRVCVHLLHRCCKGEDPTHNHEAAHTQPRENGAWLVVEFGRA